MPGSGSPLHQQPSGVSSHNSSMKEGLRETKEGRPLDEEVFTEKVTLSSTLRNTAIWIRREEDVAGHSGQRGTQAPGAAGPLVPAPDSPANRCLGEAEPPARLQSRSPPWPRHCIRPPWPPSLHPAW